MNCAYCSHNDGYVYLSFPEKYRCNITGEYHSALDECNVELAPVRHGKWIQHEDAEESYDEIFGAMMLDNFECSECHTWERNASYYCPNCGAKMSGVQSHE